MIEKIIYYFFFTRKEIKEWKYLFNYILVLLQILYQFQF